MLKKSGCGPENGFASGLFIFNESDIIEVLLDQENLFALPVGKKPYVVDPAENLPAGFYRIQYLS